MSNPNGEDQSAEHDDLWDEEVDGERADDNDDALDDQEDDQESDDEDFSQGSDDLVAADEPVSSDRLPVDLRIALNDLQTDDSLAIIRKRPSMFEPPSEKGWHLLTSSEKKYKLKMLQQECLRKEELILSLIKLRKADPRRKLPYGVLADAKQIIGAKASWKKQEPPTDRWVQKLIEDYLNYRLQYPLDPSAEFFMPLPMGRPPGQQLTDQQKSTIRYALATRARQIRSAIGRIREIDLPFEYREIWKFASSICPMPSYDTMRRYLQSYRDENPALFKLLTEGDAVVERDLLLKKRNDVGRPNERWQSDARFALVCAV